MPQKTHHYFKIEYPDVRVGTFAPIYNKDIFTKTVVFFYFVEGQHFRIRKRHNEIKFGKEVKTTLVAEC